MALGPKKAALLATTACAVVAVLLLPPGGGANEDGRRAGRVTDRTLLRARYSRLRSSLWAASSVLEALDQYDSISPLSSAPTDGYSEFSADGLSPAWERWVRSGLDRARSAVERRPSRTPVAVHVVRHTGRWGEDVTHVLPMPDGPLPCVSIFTIGERSKRTPGQAFSSEPVWRTTPDLLGICGFYREFGFPAARLDTWIHAGGWQYFRHLDVPDSLMRTVMLDNADLARLTASTDQPLAGCVMGRVDDCRRLVVEVRESPLYYAQETARAGPGYPDVIHESWISTSYTADFGSRLIEEFGRAAFEQFWTSGLPLDSAFNVAFGADLGTWTRDWIRRRVVAPANRRLQGASTPITLAVVLACLGVGVVRIIRRNA